jgi:tetratricopeptide (TPR) repeat protein
MRRWAVVVFVFVVIIALLLAGSLQVMSALLPEEQQQGVLPYVAATGLAGLVASTIISVMQWVGISPLDFLPERSLKDTLRKQDPARFSLTKNRDSKLISEQAKAAKNQNQYDWVYVFSEAWVQSKPVEADAYEMLGEALIKLNRPQEAIAIGEKLIKLEPLNYTGFSILGDAYNELGERDEACSNYERALELVPPSYREFVLRDLAKTYKLLGHADKALKALEELVPLLELNSRDYYQEQLDHMKQIVEQSQAN